MVFMYFISIFYGVNTRLAIGEFLKYANYFFVLLLGRDLSKNEKSIKAILNTLVLGSVILSVIGIGSAIGTFDVNGAYYQGRIASTLQYANALAIVLGATFAITIGLLMSENNKLSKVLYGAASNILLFTFILTQSRGMWLLLPLILFINFILLPSNKRLENLLILSGNIIITIPFVFVFLSKLEQSSTMLWLIFIASSVAMGIYFICTFSNYRMTTMESALNN